MTEQTLPPRPDHRRAFPTGIAIGACAVGLVVGGLVVALVLPSTRTVTTKTVAPAICTQATADLAQVSLDYIAALDTTKQLLALVASGSTDASTTQQITADTALAQSQQAEASALSDKAIAEGKACQGT